MPTCYGTAQIKKFLKVFHDTQGNGGGGGGGGGGVTHFPMPQSAREDVNWTLFVAGRIFKDGS